MFNLLDIILNYLTLQLGRCAILSILLLAVILCLRQTIFRHAVLARGMIWGMLLPALFLGRLRFFYESKAGICFFSWWSDLCMDHVWVSRGYFIGMFLFGTYVFNKRKKLAKFIGGMENCQIDGQKVFICRETVTPFTAGAFSPQIVLPECMLKQLKKEEVNTIIRHEKTHIRLGHLFIYLLWDFIRVLLWVNPLFAICNQYLKDDMENICDRVTMQCGGQTSYDYGEVLLHSIRLLQNMPQTEARKVDIPFTFAGEREFGRMKQRIRKIADFTEYKKSMVCCMGAAAVFILFGMFWMIFHNSYANYEENEQIRLYDAKGEKIILEDSSEIREVISYDDNYIYIDTDGLCELLLGQEIENGGFWVACGGYQKLPGYGLGGICEYVSMDKLDESRLRIPYEQNYNVLEWIYKVM